jgi:hypothetical protein
MLDFIKTGRKRPVQEYRHHSALKIFRKHFQIQRKNLILEKFGFTDLQRNYLIRFQKKKVEKFIDGFEHLESIKVSKMQNVADGINTPPLLDIKETLRLFALDLEAWADTSIHEKLPLDRLKLQVVPSEYCKRREYHKVRKLQSVMDRLSKELIDLIKYSLDLNTRGPLFLRKLLHLSKKMQNQNDPHILTGNATIQIIDLWFRKYKKTADPLEVQLGIERIVHGSPNPKELELILENRQSI